MSVHYNDLLSFNLPSTVAIISSSSSISRMMKTIAQIYLSLLCWVASESPYSNAIYACMECWERRSPGPLSIYLWHLLKCVDDQVFREHLCYFLLIVIFFLVLPQIVFFLFILVDTWGTTQWTFNYIECGLLLWATHDVDSCEWNRQCLEHVSLR